MRLFFYMKTFLKYIRIQKLKILSSRKYFDMKNPLKKIMPQRRKKYLEKKKKEAVRSKTIQKVKTIGIKTS